MKILKKKNEDKIYNYLLKLITKVEKNSRSMNVEDYCDCIDCIIALSSEVLNLKKLKQLSIDFRKVAEELNNDK